MPAKKQVWKKTFGNTRQTKPKYAASGPNMDTLYKEHINTRPNMQIIEEDNVDFEGIERKSRKQEYGRRLAARIQENHTNELREVFDGQIKTASTSSGGGGGGADIAMASAVDFYSPWLSTDYLELPRSYSEERRWYRHFYDQDPIVGRAIDLKTYIPLSKMTLGLPRCSSRARSQQVLAFFERMWQNLRMFEKVMWIIHEYNLIGEVLVYFEWDEEEKIWSKALILDPDICEVRYLPFQDETQVFLTPDNSIREVISEMMDSEETSGFALTLQELSDEAMLETEMSTIQLNTDPRQGSFVKYFGRKRSPYRPGPGVSILRRLLRTLLFRDKIRQALTQITSRHMTPIRVVSAEGLSPDDVEDLRMQVDMAIMGPDFSIVTNYPVEWNEYNPSDRIFDTTAVYEHSTEELLIGLGMTKELLFGEGSYGGGRITLQVLDTEFTLIREMITEMMNDLFKIVAEKNDFTEKDEESGVEYLIYAPLKFARMSLRDYADIFDFMYNLYNTGALDRDTMLEFLNIDPVEVENKLKRNFMTINDNQADEVRRGLIQEAVTRLVEQTDILDRIIAGFGLEKRGEDLALPDDAETSFDMDETSDFGSEGAPTEGTEEAEEVFDSSGEFESADVVPDTEPEEPAPTT